MRIEPQMKSVSVFCGSSLGADVSYARAAETLGGLLAEQRIGLVYGGGNIGLMGKVATACLAGGGHVTGVIPKFLMEKEIGKIDLPDLRIVESMHERKALMAELSEGFIALPGGFGTLEEFCEILTWGQLGLHTKPFGLLNVGGFYDDFLRFIDGAVARQFIKPKHRGLLLTAGEPGVLLEIMREWRGVSTPKWITPERT
jgi:uncharacterized protein (TIGR00730 family)